MARTNNYLIQARQAKARFLTYDQSRLIAKLNLRSDGEYLYVPMLGQTYRISRTSGDMQRQTAGDWVDGNSYDEVMTLLDLLCDSREDPEGFRKACLALGGTPLPNGDIAYAIELFDGLPIAVQLWFGDDEFPPNLRFLWDENALMYIKYETMYFAKGMLLSRIEEQMNHRV